MVEAVVMPARRRTGARVPVRVEKGEVEPMRAKDWLRMPWVVKKGVRELMRERVIEGMPLVVVEPEVVPVMLKMRKRSAVSEERGVVEARRE